METQGNKSGMVSSTMGSFQKDVYTCGNNMVQLGQIITEDGELKDGCVHVFKR